MNNYVFIFEINVDEQINTELLKIPPMLIQPFIENAVEHGMRKLKSNDGFVKIDYKLKNNQLHVCIEDNGNGIIENETSSKNHVSIATRITKERIENIRRLQKIDIQLKVENKHLGNKMGFKVSLIISKI